MWGNSLGWFISLVLLGGLVYGMHALNQVAEISEPTAFGKDPNNLAPVALPIPPARLLEMNDPADAKTLYRAAIEDYKSNRDNYDHFASRKGEAFEAEKLPGLQNLLQATRAHRTSIFADDPGELVRYGETPELDAITALGHLAARAALLKQTENPAEAQKFYEAEFSLGTKLYDERVTVAEFMAGLDLLAESGAGMARMLHKANQTGRASEFINFNDARLKYYNDRVLPMLKILQSIDANVIADHAGDIFHIARNSQERMYRVEAILAMGRMRYYVGEAGRIGNQRGAIQEVKRLANNSDPVIRRAAEEARDLTIEKYRLLK